MSAPPTLYYVGGSPPARTVLLVAKELGLELNLSLVDVRNGGTKTPEFLKMNPQHTVPTLDDNGKYLWDSHAISTYLIGKFGKSDNHPLYPKDLYVRARIDQRLQFSGGVVFPALVSLFRPLGQGAAGFDEKALQSTNDCFAFLETFLAVDPYLVGDHLTVADLAVVTGVTQIELFVPIDGTKYPKVVAWVKRLESSLPYFHEINTANMAPFKDWIAELLQKNKAAKQ